MLDQDQDYQVEPCAFCYNSMIQLYARAGHLETAEEWMQKLRSSDAGPNVYSYAAVLDACAGTGNYVRCEELVGEMRSASIPLNLVIHNTVIKAHANAGDLPGAMRCLDRIRESLLKPDLFSYGPVFHALVHAGHLADAEGLLGQMVHACLKPGQALHQALAAARQRRDKEERSTFSGVDWFEESTPDGSRCFRSAHDDSEVRGELPVSGLVQLKSENGPYFWDVATNSTSWEVPKRSSVQC